MFRNIFLFAFILLIIYAGLSIEGEETPPTQIAEASIEAPKVDRLIPKRFELIPSSDSILQNYRSAQPDSAQLSHLITTYGIEVIVRLNGDEGGMTIEEEQRLADSMQVQFVRLNAHLRDEGPGYDGSAKVLARFLQGGKVLVHCQHGHDRVGALVGHWLITNGYTTQEVIEHNQWEDYLERKGDAYQSYWETIQ